MQPAAFPESNCTLTAPPGSSDVSDLAVFRGDGMCISLWRPTWRERLSLLVHGRLWFYAIGETHPPIALEAKRTAFSAPPNGDHNNG